ncbi:PadR family transcriptional regulator [Lichenibacterium dinghuense]|uniref:PadR family transcriptional regulator n=1 Tax=Lichenibacterium dinghuense TaxID=2895977 RepID=UPI001F3EE239|nr:PadR family transcriptional regulator [Lichenibacterium sp. 6Y81]
MHPFHAFHLRFHRDHGSRDEGHGHFGRGRHHGGPSRGRSDDERRGGLFGRGRGERSDLGRFFAHGDLRLVILHLVAEKPRHGYEIIKAVEDAVGGAYSPSPGVVYPTLSLLEELGHTVVTPGEGTKKLHGITDEGRAMLEANRATLEALLRRMGEAAAAQGDGPHPSVVRAKEGLKLALRMRYARGPLTAEQSAAVAAALDAATAAVERS